MKNTLFLIFLLLTALSCEKDDDDSQNPSNSISCKIDGVNFASAGTGVFATVATSGTDVSTDYARVTIFGVMVQLSFDNVLVGIDAHLPIDVLNSHPTLTDSASCSQSLLMDCHDIYVEYRQGDSQTPPTDEFHADHPSGNSTLRITEINYENGETISGTFSGDLYNASNLKSVITEGQFSAVIQK